MARPRQGEDLKVRYERRGDSIYAYQSTSKMVDGKRKSVNIYLGKVDPETGEIMERRRSGRSKAHDEKVAAEKTIVQPEGPHMGDYGGTYLLHCIQLEAGLGDDLVRAFGPAGRTILAIAMSMAQSRLVFSSVDTAIDRYWVRWLYGIEMSMDSGSLSGFTEAVGLARNSIDEFHRLRVGRCQGMLIWDTTIRGTYGDMEGMADWLSKDQTDEDLMQVKTGMAADLRGVPVMYRHYPGSFSDMLTIKSVSDDLSRYGEVDLTCIADRGMFSANNVKYLMDQGLKVIMPGKFGYSAFDTLMTMSKIPGNSKRMVHRDHVYQVMESEVGLRRSNRKDLTADGESKYVFTLPKQPGHGSEGLFKAFLCFDTKKYSDECQMLDLAIEGLIARASRIDSPSPVAEFEMMAGPFLKYFDVEADGRGVELSVRESQVSRSHASDGYFVMLSSQDMTWEQVMSRYDARRMVEQDFDTMKGGDRRFRTGSRASMEGRELIRQVALILLGEVRARLSVLRETFSNDGARTVLEAMGCVQAVSGQRIRMPAKCRRILEEFGFPVPEYPLEGVRCTSTDEVEET